MRSFGRGFGFCFSVLLLVKDTGAVLVEDTEIEDASKGYWNSTSKGYWGRGYQ